MPLCRLILPDWAKKETPTLKKVKEGVFSDDDILEYNSLGYNIYYLPNGPSEYDSTRTLDGSHIDVFEWVFADMDLKDEVYHSKEAFLEVLAHSGVPPSKVVDSGNGVHVYWRVHNLDAMGYLRFQKRIARLFKTDIATSNLFQLMRLPGTINTKRKDSFAMCLVLSESGIAYTAEELDRLLPQITIDDEAKCQAHYDTTMGVAQEAPIDDSLPAKFGKLLASNAEVKSIWASEGEDRSKNDYRLGHLMFANGFTKEEALSVLVNTAKALQRAPVHRGSYARNIVNKIWTFEEAAPGQKASIALSPTVRDILSKGDEALVGTRFHCHRWIDDTECGFRLGHVIGIIGGSGVGKTTLTLNAFLWFVENNPDYHHFFISLEQPPGEIASRVRTICAGNDKLYDRIHIVSNYDESGTYRNLSLKAIEEHLADWKKQTGLKIGATVIDHIGVLSKETKNGENNGLIGVCQNMKAFAVNLNTILIMLSQAPREKAGIGDLELNKDAAYGTVFFESFLDYCICMWQPLKRVYPIGAPTVMAVKFAKIRHKKQGVDRIMEDVCYQFFFDPKTERLREMTQEEEKSAIYYLNQAAAARKKDRKTDVIKYDSRRLEPVKSTSEGAEDGGAESEDTRHTTSH